MNKSQWIFTKLDMCIDIVENWYQIAAGQILLIFDRVICLRQDNNGVLLFRVFISSPEPKAHGELL